MMTFKLSNSANTFYCFGLFWPMDIGQRARASQSPKDKVVFDEQIKVRKRNEMK